MKIGLLQLDKKGVSPIIGYVLLVVIALALAGGVYNFLANYAPPDAERCPDDVALVIRSLSCSGGKVNITLDNKGLFSVDGVLIKIGEEGRIVKLDLLPCDDSSCKVYFINYNQDYEDGLKPGQSVSYFEENPLLGTGEREVEIQPIILASGNVKKDIICSGAIIKQKLTCSL
ncbi:MAG: archaellin/type IV pilin N-terminal domain-containing protein [Nanoarchaeota archaeon]